MATPLLPDFQGVVRISLRLNEGRSNRCEAGSRGLVDSWNWRVKKLSALAVIYRSILIAGVTRSLSFRLINELLWLPIFTDRLVYQRVGWTALLDRHDLQSFQINLENLFLLEINLSTEGDLKGAVYRFSPFLFDHFQKELWLRQKFRGGEDT